MPSSATITAFYSFSANTRARAAQVQANFDNFRGHLIPIEPLTITSSNISHDIGSDEHRWRTGYFGTVDFDRSTTTASATFAADLNTNTGEIVATLNGTEKGRFTAKGFYGSRDVRTTTTAAQNQFSLSAGVTTATYRLTNTAESINGFTCSVVSNGGPIRYEMENMDVLASYPSQFDGTILTTTAAITGIFEFLRNGTTIGSYKFILNPGTSGAAGTGFKGPIPPLKFTDFNAPSGTNVYSIQAYSGTGAEGGGVIMTQKRMIAYQL